MSIFIETAIFSWKYLSRYWYRFVLGILLAFFFGLSNVLFLGGLYTMINRLNDPVKYQQIVEKQSEKAGGEEHVSTVDKRLKQASLNLKQEALVLIDPWLPLRGRDLDWKQALGCILFLPLMAGLRGGLNYTSSYLLAWSGQRITNDVKLDAFKKVNSLSLDFFSKTTTGALVSRIESDAVGLNNFLKMGLSDLVKEPITICCVFGGMLMIDWKFTMIALIFLPISIIPMQKIGKRIKSLGRKDIDLNAGQSHIAMEAFQNIRITKAYGLEEAQARLFKKAGELASRYNIKMVQSRGLLNPIIETCSALGISFVLLYAIWSGSAQAKIVAFFYALVVFNGSFRKLGTMGIYITQLNISMERLLELFKMKPTVVEETHPLPFPRFKEGIEFRDVTFSYGDRDVIHKINFRLGVGKKLGLAGESGSGKSSLLNLLFRFYDVTGGEILIDGKSIRSYRLQDLREHLALVSQDVLLFNGTVAENIGYGKNGATREEIKNAARRAHAQEFIEAMPQGYDTPLGERGGRLSGGQRQRIAIARAFVRNAPILVLDEATASLDSKSEAEVQSAIDELAESRTVICVAHRLSTLRDMDEILVMAKGEIIERGTFLELLKRGGKFADMAARQSIFSQEKAEELADC